MSHGNIKRTQLIALLLCACGLLLYLYEFVYKDTTLFIAAYILAIAYLLVMGLVVRPRIYNKKVEKVNRALTKLHSISTQLKNEDQ